MTNVLRRLSLVVFVCAVSLLPAQTWLENPPSNLVNDGSNYTPAVPSFGTTTALAFAASNQIAPALGENLTVNRVIFEATAPAYQFTGAGILTLSNATTNAVVLNNASAATQTIGFPLTPGGTANARWNATAGDLVLAGGIVLSNRGIFLGASTGRVLMVSGPITGGSFAVVKGANGLAQNQGILVLSNGSNSFGGAITANAGPVVLAATGAEGAATGSLNVGNTAGGDAASILVAGPDIVVARNVIVQTGSSGLLTLGGTEAFVSGTSTFAGNVTLGTNVNGRPLSLFAAGNATVVFSGAFADFPGASSLVTKTGSGTVVFSGESTATGGLQVSQGTLRLGADERLAAGQALDLAGGTFATGGFAETLGALTINASSVIELGTGSHELSFSNLNHVAGTLTVRGWSGTNAGGSGGRLRYNGTVTGEMLVNVSFEGFSPGAVVIPSTDGYLELVPSGLGATPPAIVTSPVDILSPAGTDVVLTVAATGAAPLSYQWRKGSEALVDGPGIAGAQTDTLTLAAAGMGATGSYDVIVSNSAGSTPSAVATVTVYGAPALTASPASLTVDLGQPALFAVSATSAVAPTYQWRLNGSPLNGATGPDYFIANVTEAEVGDYDVLVSNPAGTTPSAVATLAVSGNPVAPIIVSQPAGVVATAGQGAAFTVAAIGTGPLSYRWRRDAAPLGDGNGITGTTTPTLAIAAVSAAFAGAYDVVVSNAVGETVSAAGTLSVLAGATPRGKWIQMHPGGGGQVQGLSFDPNRPGRMYECSDVEGAYRSDDWGLTWVAIGEELSHHMTFHVAVTPGNSDTIYCGTLYGIQRSTDGGKTWSLIMGGYANASWAFDPFDPTGRTWLAGRSWYIKNSQLPTQTAHPSQETAGEFFILRSTDAGETIARHTYEEGNGTNQVYTIVYDRTRQGHVYIAADAGLFRSRDGGVVWEQIALPAGATFTRGADITSDGKWLYATVNGGGFNGVLHVARIDPDSTQFVWNNVHTATDLLTAAGGNYWRPRVDPRSAIPVSEGGLGETQHRVIMGSFTSSANANVGLPEGRFTDSGAAINVDGWDYAFRRAGTAPGWDYEFGWNDINPQCRQYEWMPRSWDQATPPAHLAPVDDTMRKSRILMASQQSVYFGSPEDRHSWTIVSSTYVGAQPRSGGGEAKFYRTRGFSSTVNFTMDAWETYYAQGMADNRVLESFDGGYSWTQDTVPGGARVGNGDAIHILRPRTPGEVPVALLATAPGAGGGADTAVGTLFRKTLANLNGPTDPWVNLGALPTQGLASSPRIWYIESHPANNDTVFLGTQSGLYWTDDIRAANPVFTRVANVPDSFKQGRIFVDPKSTLTHTVLHVKTNASARLFTVVGTRPDAGSPYTFSSEAMGANGNVRVLDDLYYWRRDSDAREFLAHTNSAQEIWVRERGDGEGAWSAWARVADRAAVLGVKQLSWLDWTGRGIDPSTQTIIPDLSAAPDAFTLSGLGALNDELYAAAWVEDGKHGYAMLRLVRNGLGDWTTNDWTGEAIEDSFDGLMGVARVWQSKVVQTGEGRYEYLTASRGGGLWSRTLGIVDEPPAEPLPQTISFAPVTDRSFGDEPFDLVASATSGLSVAFSIVNGPATLEGTTLTLTGVGEVTIRASQAGSETWEPAPDVVRSFTVAPGNAIVTIQGLNTVYQGTPRAVDVMTTPQALAVLVTYNGGADAPVGAGTYFVEVTVVDPNYLGAASGTLTIAPAPATLTLSGLTAVYDGTPKAVSVSTVPSGLSIKLTYDGGTVEPTDAGSYLVSASILDPNYMGGITGTLTITPAPITISLSGLNQWYDGTPRPVDVSGVPAGVPLTVTYDGRLAAPIYPGEYNVLALSDDPNRSGGAEGTLSIKTYARVRRMPALNGALDGSIQIVEPSSVTLNGTAWIARDLLMPGSPSVVLNGSPVYGGTLTADGSEEPFDHVVTINRRNVVRHVVIRVDPSPLAAVMPPTVPTGSVDVVLNRNDPPVANWSAVRNLTLNRATAAMAAGSYGAVVVNGGGTLILGTSGSIEPISYHLTSLTANQGATVRVVGPTVLTIGGDVLLNDATVEREPEAALELRLASGDLVLNRTRLVADVFAPEGAVKLNGDAVLQGVLEADHLEVNSAGGWSEGSR